MALSSSKTHLVLLGYSETTSAQLRCAEVDGLDVTLVDLKLLGEAGYVLDVAGAASHLQTHILRFDLYSFCTQLPARLLLKVLYTVHLERVAFIHCEVLIIVRETVVFKYLF